VTRWAPDSRERLQQAALELFAARGFDGVTAQEIASAAGVTERTFFRHFPTKHEVLFAEGEALLAEIVAAAAAAPPAASPEDVLRLICDRLAEMFQPRRAYLRERSRVIDREPPLREREALKDHQWSAVIAGALVRRGLSRPRSAALAAGSTALFRVVYGEWVRDRSAKPLADRLNEALDELHRGPCDRLRPE
jgi:AcrR family transcriptional regulator